MNSSDFDSKPALVAISFGTGQSELLQSLHKRLTDFEYLDLVKNLSDHLALAMVRQIDTSDLTGRIVGLGEEGELQV